MLKQAVALAMSLVRRAWDLDRGARVWRREESAHGEIEGPPFVSKTQKLGLFVKGWGAGLSW
jgi:hypothetical protein